jgi:hypothetical protein
VVRSREASSAGAVVPSATPSSSALVELPAPPSALSPPLANTVATLSSVVTAHSAGPPELAKPRRVSLAPLAAWSKPGLCSTSEEAEATREKLTASFRRSDNGALGQIHVDPRLAEGAESVVLASLAQAQSSVERSLGFKAQPPETFVYLDQELMKAAACINEDVVAFYDGALHVVADRADLQQSVTHELTHHALFGARLVGPAWAQEGIAMLVARETWWREPARLQSLLGLPFATDQMDSLIPYKLPADQAVNFYVQSALTVQCLLTLRGWTLQQLAGKLIAASGPDLVSYDLPEIQSTSFLSSCVAALATP